MGQITGKDNCYKDNDGYRLHLHIYLQPDGYTIEANWVE